MAIDYTSYDYEALLQRITDLYKTKPGIGDGYDSSTGQTLIQVLADTVDHLFFMLERRSQEVFLDTAKLDSSIIVHASELGYRPRRKVSANGILTLDLVDSNGNTVTAEGTIQIPKNTIVTLGEERFVIVGNYTIAEGESSVDVQVKEGSLQTISVNTADQDFIDTKEIVISDYSNIEEFSIEVEASDGVYTDLNDDINVRKNITSLSFASSTDKVFDIRFSNEGMRIIFGDGIFGKVPEGIVNITYVNSNGEDVNVVKTGLNFDFESFIITDDAGVTPPNEYSYTLQNTTPIRGGSASETVQEIARNAPNFVRTNSRAITAFDHEFWALRSGIGAMVDCLAYGEQESDSLVFNMNNVILTYVTNDLLPLTPSQVKDLKDYMENFKILTTHIGVREANYIKSVLNIKYRKKQNVPISIATMQDLLKSFIEEYFEIKRGSIGKEFQRSELMRDIQNMNVNIDGVSYQPTDYLDLDVEAEYLITAQNQFYDLYLWFDSYTPTDGHVWRLDVEDSTFSITVQSGDTVNDIIDRMKTELENSNLVLVAALDHNGNYSLRVKSLYYDGVYQLDLDPTDDVNNFIVTSSITNIPVDTSKDDDYKMLPNTVYLLDENDNIIYEDDGNGLMVDPNSINPSFDIDYVNGFLLSPVLPSGDIRVRFQQSSVQNIYPGPSGVVRLSPFIAGQNAFPESTITILG